MDLAVKNVLSPAPGTLLAAARVIDNSAKASSKGVASFGQQGCCWQRGCEVRFERA